MNTPYVKQFDANGVCTNPITKEKPYLHRHQSEKTRKENMKYIILHHLITGAFMGKVKVGGNNRKWFKRQPHHKAVPRTFRAA